MTVGFAPATWQSLAWQGQGIQGRNAPESLFRIHKVSSRSTPLLYPLVLDILVLLLLPF